MEFESMSALLNDGLPQQLCDAVKIIADKVGGFSTDDYWQIEAKVGHSTILTERSLWQIVFDTHTDSKNFVIEYIDNWCQIAQANKYKTLPMHDSYHFTGELVICSFLERYFDIEDITDEVEIEIYRRFIQYIKFCDLDSEYNQHHIISEVVERLRQIDKQLMAELLCYRLCNGQIGMMQLGFEFIQPFVQPMVVGKGLLKLIIDYLIAHRNEPQLRLSCDTDGYIFRFLLAAVYGNNEKETQEVLAYIQQELGVEFKAVHPNSYLHIQKIMGACDAHMRFRPESESLLDSSFHLYNLQTKRWQPYD